MSCWRFVRERRPSHAGARVSPAPADHAPVPVQQRLGLHQEHRPARPWQQPAERREQRSVGGLQPGPGGAGGAAPPAPGVTPGSRSPWPLPTRSRAGSAQGCGAAPGRRTTRPQRPPPTKVSKRRRIVTCHQAIAAGHGHDRLLAPHGLFGIRSVRCPAARQHAPRALPRTPARGRGPPRLGATRIVPMARWKNLRRPSRPRHAETNTSMTWPNCSIGAVDVAPLPSHLQIGLVDLPASPTAWRQGRTASASSGVNRTTHR